MTTKAEINLTVTVLRQEQWQTQRWQNGGGITHQLCRADDEKGMRWRLSIAEVATDGPFSRFDNIDRIIMLLDGAGFELHSAGKPLHRLAVPLKPYHFAGELPINCKLIAGPVRDFNLMTRRNDVSANLRVLTLDNAEQHISAGNHSFVYVVSGSACVRLQQQLIKLNATDMLCVAAESAHYALYCSGQAAVLYITIA